MLLRLLDELHQACSSRGLILHRTGPWPAYNFVSLNFSMEAGG